MKKYLTLILTAASALAQKIPDPLLCEDTLDVSPPFQTDSVPRLLACEAPVVVASTTFPSVPSSSYTWTAPFRVSSVSGLPQGTSNQDGQATQTSTSGSGSGSVVSTEPVQSTETGGGAVTSPTTTAAAGRLSQAGLLGVLYIVGYLIVMVA
ncbi:hypothetical protein F5Y00DRAFT_268694 [Daldinia vernicosa]|uniref:uncharacterized protein n=1 Tax=Daldinia vernicosa TaxID=114800 RepID=UPI002008E962|nr:uncharacterized protein F5Y00DRAFT_268694 [Daldinia vernicosa]KAI0849919.1 hypothetical protein F5Y00DRAFT_268694 [Daldinia vernicosa]